MTKKALQSPSFFVPAGKNPEKMISWKKVDCEIRNRDGNPIFSMKNVEAPEGWSQLAIDIAASKYFRKSGLPGKVKAENSVRQLVNRVVNAIEKSALTQKNYFTSKKEAQIFAQELKYILLTQRGAFNSPVFQIISIARIKIMDLRGNPLRVSKKKTNNVLSPNQMMVAKMRNAIHSCCEARRPH
jgi:ribonucleoside-diphosphate reductase alpha chain